MTPPLSAPSSSPWSESERIVRDHNDFCIGHYEDAAPWCSAAPKDTPLCHGCEQLRQSINAALDRARLQVAQAHQQEIDALSTNPTRLERQTEEAQAAVEHERNELITFLQDLAAARLADCDALRGQLATAHQQLEYERGTVQMLRDLQESLLPCGHPSAWAETTDGGKHIICLRCSLSTAHQEIERLKAGKPTDWQARLDQSEAEIAAHLKGATTPK